MIDLDNMLAQGAGAPNSTAEIKDVPGCIFFYASSANDVTEGIDKGISWIRSAVGDSNADDAITAHKYSQRDCTTLRIAGDPSKYGDRCLTVPGADAIKMTVLVCTCVSDKCNEGKDSVHLKGLIADAMDNAMGIQYDKKLIGTATTMAILFATTYMKHLFY